MTVLAKRQLQTELLLTIAVETGGTLHAQYAIGDNYAGS